MVRLMMATRPNHSRGSTPHTRVSRWGTRSPPTHNEVCWCRTDSVGPCACLLLVSLARGRAQKREKGKGGTERVVCNHLPRLDRGIDWIFLSAPDKRGLLSLSGMRGAWRSVMRRPTAVQSMRRLSSWDLALTSGEKRPEEDEGERPTWARWEVGGGRSVETRGGGGRGEDVAEKRNSTTAPTTSCGAMSERDHG